MQFVIIKSNTLVFCGRSDSKKPDIKIIKMLILLLLATKIIECKIIEEEINDEKKKDDYGKKIKVLAIVYMRDNECDGLVNENKYKMLSIVQ